jgi:hypothetical protein
MDQLELRRRLRVGDRLEFEPLQLDGQQAAYQILSIDGNLVKVSTPEGFRLLPLYMLTNCHNEGRLRVNGKQI